MVTFRKISSVTRKPAYSTAKIKAQPGSFSRILNYGLRRLPRDNYKHYANYLRFMIFFLRLIGIRSVTTRLGTAPFRVLTNDMWGFGRYYVRRKACGCAYFAEIRDFLTSHRNAVFWDIGANYGVYSLEFGRFSSHVVACEPNAQVFKLLELNLRHLDVPVRCLPVGVSDRTETTTMSIPNLGTADGRVGDVQAAPDRRAQDAKGRRTEPVNVTSIDRIVSEEFGQLPRHHVIKIDVQGLEGKVLAGARHMIGAAEEILILLEVWREGLEESGDNITHLGEVIESLGFGRVVCDGQEMDLGQFVSRVEKSDRATVRDILLRKHAA